MTEVAQRIADLSEARLRLLAKLRREGETSVGPIPAGAVAEGQQAPLSFAQRRLWFVHQMGAGHATYNAPVIHRIRGPLDVDALTESLRLLLVRHPSLRTVFPEHDGEPVQVVRKVPEPVIRTLSVSSWPTAERERLADHIIRTEVQTPFDLTVGPVIRTTLIELADDEHLLVLNIHHITSDQWSMGVLVRELAECYAARSEGREPDLPPLPVSYADFAVWQRNQPSLTEELNHWGERLTDLPETDLPADRARPPLPSHRGAETALWLDAGTVSAVHQVGELVGVSPFMTLLAAFAGLITRYTGQPDVAVGTTSAGRDNDQLAGLVGFFVNTLVLRVDAGKNPTFRQLLDRVRETILDAHQHEGVPFDVLVEHLRPTRDPSRPPLVSIMFQQDNTPDCALRLHGAQTELVDDFDPGTAKYDLLVSVRIWDEAARVHVQYSTDLFDAATIDVLLSAYRTLLSAAAADPETRLGKLPLLDDSTRHRMLVEWNNTDTHLVDDVCLHELFAHQAAQHPDAPAAITDAGTFGFAELDQRANRLAHRLVGLGIGPGHLVAVHLPPGVEHLVAVLAILKAGGAFVSVDPDHPDAHVEFILTDSAARVVITNDTLAPRIGNRATIVSITDDPDRPSTPPDIQVTPNDACYVIYTSGSTGEPKGAVLRHRGVVNNLADLNTRFAVGPGDKVLALSSPNFDMSVYEQLGVPAAGGTVVFPTHELLRDPAHWAELIAEHGVTLWNSVPAFLELLLDHAEQSVEQPPETLRLALLGGDWIPVDLPDRIRALAPGLEFVSLGGATEVSIHSLIHVVTDVDPEWTAIPYGRPLANQHVYILDERGQPLPVGVPGELHIGGVGVGLGYLDRPELTAKKFVVRNDERVYRTGDIARWRPDGIVELLGRKDFMVKVNGARIELGEVEAALRAHPSVAAAVATVARDETGHPHLVGHVCLRSTSEEEELRAFLRERLPAYLRPNRVIVLDRFPMTPNGKIDRRALAEYSPTANPLAEPPQGPVEEQVAAVWREVLGVPTVNRTDDFFALGGDSFKAVRAARLIDERLSVIAVFHNPTVAGLAEHLSQSQEDFAAPAWIHHLSRTTDPTPTTLICVPYGGGNAVAYQPLADALDGRIAVWAVDLPGHDPADPRPLATGADIARECAQQIKAKINGPIALYGQCAGTTTTLLIARELEAIGVPVTATFMAAALPDPNPDQSWQILTDNTDDQLLQHMRGLGGFDGVLDDEDIERMLRVVRHDLVEMVGLYRAEAGTPPIQLAGPVHCLVGDEDPATDGYQRRYREWGSYGADATLSVVPGGGHYFCKHQAQDVAEIVAERLAGAE